MSERLTIIVGEYTISKLRSGEAVEFDNGVTLIPASDLATTVTLRDRVVKLEALLTECDEELELLDQGPWVVALRARIAVLKDAPQ